MPVDFLRHFGTKLCIIVKTRTNNNLDFSGLPALLAEQIVIGVRTENRAQKQARNALLTYVNLCHFARANNNILFILGAIRMCIARGAS